MPQPRQIQATSVTYTTAQGNADFLIYWARPGIEPACSWIPVRFVSTEPRREGNGMTILKPVKLPLSLTRILPHFHNWIKYWDGKWNDNWFTLVMIPHVPPQGRGQLNQILLEIPTSSCYPMSLESGKFDLNPPLYLMLFFFLMRVAMFISDSLSLFFFFFFFATPSAWARDWICATAANWATTV